MFVRLGAIISTDMVKGRRGEELNKHSCFRSDPIVCFMLVSCSPCNHVQFI